MTDRPMMACGHTAQGTKVGGAPVCVPCYGIRPGADVVVATPVVEGRMMRCSYANRPTEKTQHKGGGQYAGVTYPSVKPSNPQAAFFASKPDAAEDEFYCGCWGWD